MGFRSLPKFLKKEEPQLAADDDDQDQSNIKEKSRDDDDVGKHGRMDHEFIDGFNVGMDIDDDDEKYIMELKGQKMDYCHWDQWLMPNNVYEDGNGNYLVEEDYSWRMHFQEDRRRIKKEPEYTTFWEDENDEEDDDDDEKKMSLNLSLNYQEVLDAWSDRTLWANDSSVPTTPNHHAHVMGEVAPAATIEEERKQREARVLRYKEKRQTRLFSKKIRYEVRKLNADKRPRLKGRFVKRVAEKMHK